MLTGSAVILAGGSSSRMGFDKQCIRLNGRLLIEQQIHELQNIFNEIIIVTNRPELYEAYNCRLTADWLKDFGPLGGIHAGLLAAENQFIYFLACDMPYINREYILYMLSLINNASPETLAVITRFGGWLEPFNAFYSKAAIPRIEEAYNEKTYKISDIFAKAQVAYIEEAAARCFSPDWSMFTNINTQKDFSILKRI